MTGIAFQVKTARLKHSISQKRSRRIMAKWDVQPELWVYVALGWAFEPTAGKRGDDVSITVHLPRISNGLDARGAKGSERG